MVILKIIFFVWLSWCIFWRIFSRISAILKILSIEDKKVRQLYWAVQFNRKKRIDQLLKEGVDINYQIPVNKKDPYKERGTTTLLAWLLIHHSHGSFLTKRMYVYLLKKGADPLIPTIKIMGHVSERITVAQYVAEIFRSFYLRKMLEIAKPDAKQMNMVETDSIPLIASLYGWNYKNFQMLLDYGVYPRRGYYWKEEDGSISQEYKESVFVDLFGNPGVGLKGVYMWLQKGLDYTDVDPNYPEKMYILKYFENNRNNKGVWASNLINFDHGEDYIPKIIKFLENKGVKVKLKLRMKNEKYITKNGKMILYVKTKKGKWKPYSKTWQYFINKYWYYNKTATLITTALRKCKIV